MYRLKPDQENFQIVDGPFTGKKYERGKSYDRIPPEEAHRFEETEEKNNLTQRTQRAQRKNDEIYHEGHEET